MNQSIPRANVLIPSELERQQIFNWLQTLSSLTAWRRILGFYQDWATATENSVHDAREFGWAASTSLPESELLLIQKGLAHCKQGVEKLSRGDKRVFRFDANGEFAMAFNILSHWRKMITRIDDGENGIDELHTPLWGQFRKAVIDAHLAWCECSMDTIEPRYQGEPGLTLYGDWLKAELKNISFPIVLEEVPDPIQNTFVRTNGYTPCSGIWEPIEVLHRKVSFMNLFTREATPLPPFKIMGAMNYLHGNSKTPQITVETSTDNIDLDTTWRLLWRDDRYTDGGIPQREANYYFSEPAKSGGAASG